MKVVKVMKSMMKTYNHKHLKIINHKLLIKLLKILIYLLIMVNKLFK